MSADRPALTKAQERAVIDALGEYSTDEYVRRIADVFAWLSPSGRLAKVTGRGGHDRIYRALPAAFDVQEGALRAGFMRLYRDCVDIHLRHHVPTAAQLGTLAEIEELTEEAVHWEILETSKRGAGTAKLTAYVEARRASRAA